MTYVCRTDIQPVHLVSHYRKVLYETDWKWQKKRLLMNSVAIRSILIWNRNDFFLFARWTIVKFFIMITLWILYKGLTSLEWIFYLNHSGKSNVAAVCLIHKHPLKKFLTNKVDQLLVSKENHASKKSWIET